MTTTNEEHRLPPPPKLANPNNQWVRATQKLLANSQTPFEEVVDDLINMSSGVSCPPIFNKDMALHFTEDKSEAFVESRLGELAPVMLEYLDHDENEWIAELLLTPVLAMLVCDLYQLAPDNFPQTRLTLYSKILGLVIRHAVKKGQVTLPLNESEDIVANFDVLSFTGSARELFLKLAGLARIAHEKEVPMFNQVFVEEAKCSDKALNFGLLGGCKGDSGAQYSFHHLSFKEFLVAFIYGNEIAELKPLPSPPADFSKPLLLLDKPYVPASPEPHRVKLYEIAKTLLSPREEAALLQFLGPQIPEELHCHYFYIINTWLHCDWDHYGPERHGVATAVECAREVLTGTTKLFPDNLRLLRGTIIRHTSALDLALISRGMRLNKDIRHIDMRFDGYVERVGEKEKFVPVTRRGKRALKRFLDTVKDSAQVDDLSIEGPTHEVVSVFSAEGFLALCSAVTTCPLRQLFLLNCGLEDEEAKNLAEVLKDHQHLQTLSLSQNQIGGEGAHAIAEALKTNTMLSGLYLYKNRIGDAGATAMGKMLKVNKTLTTLYININEIGDDGASAVGEGLKENKGLEKLYFFKNCIGPAGAAALAEGLKENKVLKELFLDQNQIADAGAIALGEGLRVNTALKKIMLNKNDISDEGCFALADGLKENTCLQAIYIWSNSYSDNGAKCLQTLTHINTVSA